MGARPPLGVLVKLTAKGALPELALALSPTLNGGLTVIVSTLAEAVWLAASVTVRLTLKLPAAV
jgi:hypothetical protein